MSVRCALCGGACAGADLAPFLDSRLTWLWDQVAAAADRRGDPALIEGILDVRTPDLPEHRAAAGGLLGGRLLRPRQTRRVHLAELTLKLRVRGSYITPGAIAAHAMCRPLATRAKAQAERGDKEQQLQGAFTDLLGSLCNGMAVRPDPTRVWPTLRRAGWIARLISIDGAAALMRTAVVIVAALPCEGARVDRRRLATDATGSPHALDEGTTLAGLVLAILVATGHVRPRQRPRAAWAEAGVDCDDVTGGLVTVGIVPVGWSLPAGATVTLPPRVLNVCKWPQPETDEAWVFVTENPSVASAAADLAFHGATVRLLCTSGTPSGREIGAIARLAVTGWCVAVRADFDEAGLGHVAALLGAVPGAVPWRMGAEDYLSSLTATHNVGPEFDADPLQGTPWDERLSAMMRERGVAAYEESLLPMLLEDLRRGAPRSTG